MIALRLLGSPSLVTDEGSPIRGAAAQRHRIALLALLAIAGERGLNREKLMTYLWPDRELERARQLLNQAVYRLRKGLGEDVVGSTGDELRLNTDRIDVDVVQFNAALDRGDDLAAVELYHGPLLDGFFLSEATEFERWTDRERARIARAYEKSLESLAEAAESASDWNRAAHWWSSRAAHDPYDSRVAMRLMQALAASGNAAGALQHASIHEQLLQKDLGAKPAADLFALVKRLPDEPGRSISAVTDPGVPSVAPRRGDELDTGNSPTVRQSPTVAGTAGSVPLSEPRGAGRFPRFLMYSVAVLSLGFLVTIGSWRPGPNADVSPPNRARQRRVNRRGALQRTSSIVSQMIRGGFAATARRAGASGFFSKRSRWIRRTQQRGLGSRACMAALQTFRRIRRDTTNCPSRHRERRSHSTTHSPRRTQCSASDVCTHSISRPRKSTSCEQSSSIRKVASPISGW